MMPLTCVAISWLLVTVTVPPAPVIAAHWNRIESGPDSVAVAKFARFVSSASPLLDGMVESSTTPALSVTNLQGLSNTAFTEAMFVFAVITYDPDGNDTDKMVTNCGLAPCPGIVTPEQDGNKHEAEYA